MIFFKIIFIDFIIFNIELVENYNFRFLYETLTIFPWMIFLFCFFVMIFFKIIFIDFIFLILNWLKN
jgi:hypothetical protein